MIRLISIDLIPALNPRRSRGFSAGIKAGGIYSTGNCKYMDPDGDYFIVEWDGISGGKPLPWEFVQGTGKWKGIKGGGTA